MSTTIKLSDDFMKIPKLDEAGKNWVIYKARFLWSIDARGKLEHVDGSAIAPADPITRTANQVLTPAEDVLNAEWRKELKTWNQGEAIVKQQIAATISDSQFMKICGKPTAYDIWDTLTREFENKSRTVSVDLRRRLQQERCPDRGDVRAHFNKLRVMREDLAAMGHPPSEDDFYAIIMGSLPPSFDPYISAVNATSSVIGTTLSAEDLMQTVTEEYERRILNARGSKKDSENAAFYTNDGGKGRKAGPSSRKNVECFNCGKKGHYKADCWADGGGKAGQGPKGKGKGKEKEGGGGDKGKETAASAKVGGDSDDEFAWMATLSDDDDFDHVSDDNFTLSEDELLEMISSTSETDSMPGLMDYSDLEQDNDTDDDYFDSDSESLPDLMGVSDSESEWDSEDDSDEDDGYKVVYSPTSKSVHNLNTDDEAHTTMTSTTLTSNHSLVDIELYDSGASRHMTGYRHRLFNFSPIDPKPITAADKHKFYATGKGDMYVDIPDGESTTKQLLRDVLYAPSMNVTLVSISRIAQAGSTVIFSGTTCRIYNEKRQQLGKVEVQNGLYRVFTARPDVAGYAGRVTEVLTIDDLHRRLGHVSHQAARRMVEKGIVKGVELDEGSQPSFCESCQWGKGHRKAIRKEREGGREAAVGNIIHSDLWGPSPTESINRKLYFVSFTDDHTRFTKIYLLHSKDQAYMSYTNFEAWLKTQYNAIIRKLHTDRGGEYLSTEFSTHLMEAGTVRELTVHDTPEYNGLAERLNRTLLERVRAMLHDSGLPHFLWGEALHHAVYLKNRSSTRALDDSTPLEILTHSKPNISHLHPWGCEVWVHDKSGSKLDGRSKKGKWVGFDEESNGHRVYWVEKRSVTVERSVTFVPVADDVELEGEFEKDEPSIPAKSSQRATVEDAPNDNETTTPQHEVKANVPLCRSSRSRKDSSYVRDIKEGLGSSSNLPSATSFPRGLQLAPEAVVEEAIEEEGEVNEGLLADAWEITDAMDFAMAMAMDAVEGLNPTYDEARKRSDWPKWEVAIKAELASLEANGTWKIVERPPNANVVGSKWVLRIKKNAAGEIDKYKARLVARGFTQVHGVDYTETYAPVARLSTFRYLIALANRNGWQLDCVDFDSAFLNSVLGEDEVIYLEQPCGFAKENSREYVYRLSKSLYGLKQGARNWYEALKKALKELRFKVLEADNGVFVKVVGEDILIVAVHVDDCLVTSSSRDLITKFKVDIDKKYKITDLGECTWLLGIKISWDHANKTISLSQTSYIDTILARFNFDDLKPSSIPIDPSQPLARSQCPSKLTDIAHMKNIPYREAVGSLMYASMGTRPDITFATNTVAQFVDNPAWIHWEAVKRIFRYLKGTRGLELVYGGQKMDLVGFVDADGASQEHRRAISGYVFVVDGGAVSWSSKKQELVTLSTTEAEYVAATHAAKEAVWLCSLISEIFAPLEITLTNPTTLHGDNQSAIALAHGGSYHARTKHIDIRYHFIRYIIEAGSIKLIYCPTDEQTADTLTKALPSTKAKHFADSMGLRAV